MPIDHEAYQQTLTAMMKKYPGTVGHDLDRNPPRISTGSYELDRATGGGIPLGRMTYMWGAYSAGKTLTAWNIARHAQELGIGPVVYYNIENVFDEDYVNALGVKTDAENFLLVDGTIIEEVGTKAEALIDAGVQLHIFDSLAAAIPLDELNTALDNNPARALRARAWGRVVGKLNARKKKDTAIIMLDQARVAMTYMGADKPASSDVVWHDASLRIRFRKGKWLYYDKDGYLDEDGSNTDTLTGQTEANGVVINALVEKSKVGKPFRTASMYLDYGKTSKDIPNFDYSYELEKAAKFFKVVERSGAWYTLPSGEKCQGRKGIRKALEENKELRDQVINAIKEDY